MMDDDVMSFLTEHQVLRRDLFTMKDAKHVHFESKISFTLKYKWIFGCLDSNIFRKSWNDDNKQLWEGLIVVRMENLKFLWIQIYLGIRNIILNKHSKFLKISTIKIEIMFCDFFKHFKIFFLFSVEVLSIF
jgi:hypothetical protein